MKQQQKIRLVLAAIALAGAVYCSFRLAQVKNAGSVSDAKWEQKISSSHSRDALDWLKSGSPATRTVTGGDGNGPAYEEAQAMVTDLYKKGAKKVWAVDIKTDAVKQDTNALVVELPQSVDRRVLFDWESGFARSHGWDPQLDTGQKYMLLWWQ